MNKLTSDCLNPSDTFSVGFREVTPDQFYPEKWREITVNIGGTQALQEIKVPERAGGYAYKDQVKLYTRNRFLYWRLSHDVLELVEHSLDVNLVGNALRYHFQDMPVLEGVSVHETDTSVVILVATVSSVHRLTFPHPDKICSMESAEFAVMHHPEVGIKSIFADAKLADVKDPSTFYVINNMATNATLPHISASLLTSEMDSLFALAYANGGLLLLHMMADTGSVTVKELKEDSYVPRILSGFRNVFMGGRNSLPQKAVSLVLHNIGMETYLFCLYHDGCLAMWSCGHVACLCSLDLPQSVGGEPGRFTTEGVQSHLLRKAHDLQDSSLLLAVYLCFAAGSEIVLVKPVAQPGAWFKLEHLRTIQTPANDLVELSLSSHCLWGVWRGPHALMQVSRIVLSADTSGWQMAYLESPTDIETLVEPNMDVGHQCMSYIFNSGHFSTTVISRALSLFRRSSLMPETSLSYKTLFDRVSQTVDDEISRTLEENEELTDNEFLQVQSQCWLQFTSGCVQYNEASTRPVGLTLIGESGIVLIKRQQYSLLRPMETLEHLFLSGSGSLPSVDDIHSSGLVSLMSLLSVLDDNISSEIKTQFEKMMMELISPDQIITKLIQQDTSGSETLLDASFLHHLGQSLQIVGDVYSAMAQLVHMLTLSLTDDEEDVIQDSLRHMLKLSPTLSCLYGSSMGTSIISQSLHQIVTARFHICRNLLVLQHLLIEYQQLLGVNSEHVQLDNMRSVLVPRMAVLTQAYFSVAWLGNEVASFPTPAIAEYTLESLAVLGLDKNLQLQTSSVRSHEQRPISVLELLMHSTRAAPAKALLASLDLSDDDLALWSYAMVQYVMLLGKFVWPISNFLAVPQLLLSLGQFRLVQEYVRLLTGWCEWNSYLRQFMLGASLLYSKEPYKALDVLQKASKKESVETLLNYLTGNVKQSESEEESVLIRYYLLLIEMFRFFKLWECVLQLTQTAIIHATTQSEQAKLHVIAFNTYLQQANYSEAFNSLAAIGDKERSRLCLHQLVVTMFEQRHLKALMNFPQQSMFEDLEDVILNRARAMDLQRSCYYNFLYSFHMKQGNVRKAAAVMIEQGLRLGQEVPATLESVKSQAQCYLACLNALRLASPNYAWILKPKIYPSAAEEENVSEENVSVQSPKRHVEGAEIFEMNVCENIDLLEVADIEREYELVKARLALLKSDPQYFTSVASHLTPSEVVTACTNTGFYEMALCLASRYSMPLEPILVHLAHTCVDMTKMGCKNSSEVWSWLKENDVWEFGIGDANALDLSWKLLEMLLTRYEKPHQSSLHKTVAQTLLHAGFFLPHWLLSSYRCRNSSELLRVYMSAGRLEEAAHLAQQMMWATLGRYKDEFGLKTTLSPDAPYAYVPLHTIDWLVLELKAAAENEPAVYSELLEEVEDVRHRYTTEALKVTEELVFRSRKKIRHNVE